MIHTYILPKLFSFYFIAILTCEQRLIIINLFHIYIYIYICVCVCCEVCVQYNEYIAYKAQYNVTSRPLTSL